MFFKKLSDKEQKEAEFLLYSKQVRALTKSNLKTYVIDEYVDGDRVVDHKVSIKACFEAELPVYVASHPYNLQGVSSEYNLKKGSKSTMLPEELLEHVVDSDDFFT